MNKTNESSINPIADLYATVEADNEIGRKYRSTFTWNNCYNLHYNSKVEELNSQKIQDSIDLDSWDDKSDPIHKSNQKQFKSFNSNLFAAYINKFSDDDKQLAIQVILNSLYENGINLCLRDND